MPEYVVTVPMAPITVDGWIQEIRYGDTVTIPAKQAQYLLDLGAIKPAGELNAEEQAAKDEAEEKADAEGEGEKLTEKQALVKRAEELEIDTEGTIPELKERIATKEAEGK